MLRRAFLSCVLCFLVSACAGYTIPSSHEGNSAHLVVVRDHVPRQWITSGEARLAPELIAPFIERASESCPLGYEIVEGPRTLYADVSTGSYGFVVPGIKGATGRAKIICNTSGETPTRAPLPETAEPVEINVAGQVLSVAAALDQTMAFVSWQPDHKVSALLVETAAAQVTQCEAILPPGALSFVPGFTNLSPLNFKSRRVWVNTYCTGDTRPRVRGLPDGLGLGLLTTQTSYPAQGKTYLSYNHQHGYQISLLAEGGRGWLWYPGNRVGVAGRWKQDSAQICFNYPNSYNPVTEQLGGKFECRPLALVRRGVVAELPGDPFDLASGKVPYPRGRCDAPEAFSFDRTALECVPKSN